jgi:hypothetical protein
MVRPYTGLDTIEPKLDTLERFASERIPAVYERLRVLAGPSAFPEGREGRVGITARYRTVG